MKIRELIQRLEKIEQEHGEIESKIYLSFSKTENIINDVYYDDVTNEVIVPTYG